MKRTKTNMEKEYSCSKCGQIVYQDQLITVTNPAWIMKPTDDECCPYCKELCIEIEPDEENDNE